MPSIETGLWIVMVVVAAGFTFVGFNQKVKNTGAKTGAFFHILAMTFWVALSVLHAGGYEVSAMTSISDGTTTWTETEIFIEEGQGGTWLSWLFLAFAILMLFSFMRDVITV